MKAIIDTCVIVDFLQKREPFASAARDVMRLAASGLFEGYTTAKAVTDIFFLVGSTMCNTARTRQTISELLTIIGVMDTTMNDVQQALCATVQNFDDAVMLETARRERVHCIITRNCKDYIKASVAVYTPAEFVKLMRESTPPIL